MLFVKLLHSAIALVSLRPHYLQLRLQASSSGPNYLQLTEWSIWVASIAVPDG